MDCIFCRIVKKEIPASVVYEEDAVLAFLDINPVSDGHLLLIPKNHYAAMTDAPNAVIAAVFSRAKWLMPRLKDAMNADFVVVTVIGTDVPHFHVHLIPRKKGDDLAGFWPKKTYAPGMTESIAQKVKASLL